MTASSLDFVLSLALAVALGTIVLAVGTKVIAGIRLPFMASLRAAFIAQMLTAVVSFGLGFLLADHLGIALVLTIGLGIFLQAVVFQIAVRATAQTLPAGKAYIIALLNVLAGLFIASPLVAWIMGSTSA
jgi:hypothetical protein